MHPIPASVERRPVGIHGAGSQDRPRKADASIQIDPRARPQSANRDKKAGSLGRAERADNQLVKNPFGLSTPMKRGPVTRYGADVWGLNG